MPSGTICSPTVSGLRYSVDQRKDWTRRRVAPNSSVAWRSRVWPPGPTTTSAEKVPSAATATAWSLRVRLSIAPAPLVTLPVTVTTGLPGAPVRVAPRGGKSTSICGRQAFESTGSTMQIPSAPQRLAVQALSSSHCESWTQRPSPPVVSLGPVEVEVDVSPPLSVALAPTTVSSPQAASVSPKRQVRATGATERRIAEKNTTAAGGGGGDEPFPAGRR